MSKRKVITKRKQMIALPSAMVEIINGMNVSKIQKNHMLNIIRLFFSKSQKKKLPLDSVFEFPSLYFEKSIGHRYFQALNPLIQSGLILITSNYSTDLHKCRSFKLNPALLSGEFVQVPIEIYYRKNDLSDVESNELGIDITDPNLPECINTRKILKKLKLDVRGAKKRLAEYLQEGNYDKWVVVDPDLPHRQVIAVSNYKDFNLSRKYKMAIFVRWIAYDTGKKLIKDKNKYLIQNPKEYLKLKKVMVRESYQTAISNLQQQYIYAHRNLTNHRLDSNITSFPELLMPYVMFEKRPLVSIDLKNAQFTILASLIEKGEFEDYIPNAHVNSTKVDLDKLQQKNSMGIVQLGSENLPKKSKKFPIAILTVFNKRIEFFPCLSLSFFMYSAYPAVYPISYSFQLFNFSSIPDSITSTIPVLISYIFTLLKPDIHHSNFTCPFDFSLYFPPASSNYMFCTFCQNEGVEHAETPVFTDDVALFIKLAKSGKLYEYIQKVLNLPEGASGRTLAKTMMFEICFSSRLNHSSMKKQLKQIFPNVVSIIDTYKKRNGDNQFPILLQKTEAAIFIDKIFKRLQEEGYTVLTKHDSILCPESQKTEVERIVRELLDEELGEYELSVKQYSRNV